MIINITIFLSSATFNGRWIGERMFASERRVLGHGESRTWTLTFDANKVRLNFEKTDGAKAELHGETSE
jgi:hypothetical protein